MRRYFPLITIVFLLNTTVAWCQNGGFGNFAGKDTSISCSMNCFTLRSWVPDIRTTTDYTVAAVPYQPYAYVTGAPALVLKDNNGNDCSSQDDKFFDATNISFPFCFYGQPYSQMVIGTNGIVTFDISNAKNCSHFDLTPPAKPIPYKGNSEPCTSSNCPDITTVSGFPDKDVLYPRACIMGVYHDMNIDSSSVNKKMEFRIEGIAPLRRAVISFNAVPLYGCSNVQVTHQIVIYENTNVIEVYVQDNPYCPGAEPDNDGNSILGIQNWNRDRAVAPPSRNLGKWGAVGMNEGWRFTPAGGASVFANKVELLQNGSVVASGVVGTLSNGGYNVDFPNVCPSLTTNIYTVRSYYTRCDGVEFFIEDDINVNKAPNFTATATVTNASCTVGSTGTITVEPSGPQYQYSKDGGATWQASNLFTLNAGTYTLRVNQTGTGCTNDITKTITNFTPIVLTATKTDLPCFGQPFGKITLNPSGSVGPYTFSKDGGATFQPGNEFTGLAAGTYPVIVKDATGCGLDTSFTLDQPARLSAAATGTAASCNGDDAVITIAAEGGTPIYQYSVNNGIVYQNSNVFKVPPGNYNFITVRDANNCIRTVTPVTVSLVDDMVLALGADTTICSGTAISLQPQTNPETSIFNWTPATGLNSATSKNPLASPADTVTYTLKAKWRACERTASIKINVLKKPVVNAGADTTICDRSFAVLHGTATNLSGTVNYQWNPAQEVDQPTLPDVTVRPPSTESFVFTVTDNYGCNYKIKDEVLVTVKPPVPAFAGNDTNAIVNQPFRMMASGGVDYEWVPAGPLSDARSQFPIATLSNDTKFTVYVKDEQGCSGSDEVFIKVYQGPAYYTPNAFSPNGDGLNDVFTPVPVGIVQTTWFRVFNRFGELVFESTKFREGWNGTYKGQLQNGGTYIWMIKGIDKDGKTIEKKGTVLLVR